MDRLGLGKWVHCGVCDKGFYNPPETVYKLKWGNSFTYYCCYTCYRQAKKKFDNKKKQKRRA